MLGVASYPPLRPEGVVVRHPLLAGGHGLVAEDVGGPRPAPVHQPSAAGLQLQRHRQLSVKRRRRQFSVIVTTVRLLFQIIFLFYYGPYVCRGHGHHPHGLPDHRPQVGEPEDTSRLEEGAECRVRRLTLPPQLEMSLPL